jgi:hypothetical protein
LHLIRHRDAAPSDKLRRFDRANIARERRTGLMTSGNAKKKAIFWRYVQFAAHFENILLAYD